MTEQIRPIADRIRGLRRIARLTAETCARELSIPIDTHRSCESGEADTLASFLYQIAHRFNAEMSSLLEKKMEPFLITVQPRPESDPIPLNSHPGQEFNYAVQVPLNHRVRDGAAQTISGKIRRVDIREKNAE